MQTKIFTYIDKSLMKAWESLWKKSEYANYSNGPQWFLSTIESFSYKNYAIVALYDEEKLVGIGGMVQEKRLGLTIYTVSPNDFVCGLPFLINPTNREELEIFLNAVKSLGTISFDNVPQNIVELFAATIPETEITETTLNFYLDLQKEEDGSLHLSNRKKMLHNISGRDEEFTLAVFDGTQLEGLQLVFEIDDNSRKQGRGYNAFASEQTKNFYLTLASNFQKHFQVNILYFKKEPIAYEIGFSVGKTYFGNQIAFIGEYSKYTPGKVILVRLLDYLHEQKTKKFDFGSGDSNVKRAITHDYNLLFQVVFSNNSVSRNYLKTTKMMKASIYNRLQQHPTLYTAYRKSLKLIQR